MKKAISLLIVFVVCLSLCACGSGQPSKSPGTLSGTARHVIALNDLVLAEDDNVKISLVDFYTNERISAGNSDGGKCATFKVENKTGHNLRVHVIPYLNNEQLTASTIEGNTTIEAGRIGRIGYMFTYGIYNPSDVESLEDLYGLEFTIELSIDSGASNSEQYTVQCSVAAALDGDSTP